MAKDTAQLSAAKVSYKNARSEGNRQEQARWANVIGDILKNRGEYVEALRWLRIDYELSIKYLPEKHLLPTCQSLGEVYLRLQQYQDALVYQKKHLDLAKDANDLIEQQRASTQLGRTYHEMFLKSDEDHYSVRNAKKYFKSAMRLAEKLKKNSPTNKTSFVKEYIDAHNNIGMLEMDLDNLEEAKTMLTKGLEICDEEEIGEDDDCRSRLHHNLGSVYMELRIWKEAREHVEKDIIICKRIGHCQGEAKGYINLGELHYRIQKYEEAIRCYEKALELAQSMEDEDALAGQIDQNIDTVKEAVKVMEDLRKEEQNFKKLTRDIAAARGTERERKCLLQQNASLDRLIEKSSMTFAWLKHHEFAKRKKRIANELRDKEKLSDSYLILGESYQKLRNFKKAIKWFNKSWETYKSIGNLEGQALTKINIGDVLDCDGDWMEALSAFEEGYRIASEAKLPTIQLTALENMHYSHMIRFDNVDEARRLQLEIDNLKQLEIRELEKQKSTRDYCSETDTDESDYLSESKSKSMAKLCSTRSETLESVEIMNDDVPLVSLLQSSKRSSNIKAARAEECKVHENLTKASKKCFTGNQQTIVGRKRIRVVLSDDEDDFPNGSDISKEKTTECLVEDVATSDEKRRKSNSGGCACRFQDSSAVASHCATSSSGPINVEESASSYKFRTHNMVTDGKVLGSLSTNENVSTSDLAASGSGHEFDITKNLVDKLNPGHLNLHNSNCCTTQHITFRIDNDLIQVEAGSYNAVDKLDIESLKVELACLYYLHLSMDRRSKGLLPIIHQMKYVDQVLESCESLDTFKNGPGNIVIEVSIAGWVQKRLMKLYIDSCIELSETPNMKLLQRLYISEVEDEVIASDCELQDISISPLLNALHIHKTFAMLDLSHNLLGNGTMEKLQQFLISGQKYGDLTLDLHCNRFGPSALFQICECPVLFTRLEVLNLSGNRLTDTCGSFLSTILEKCKALYSLNIERCSITSRTIQKVSDALNDCSILAQLSIGHNQPISGNVLNNLLTKLVTLKSFTELSLSGLSLNKPVIDTLCQLAKTSSLSRLILGRTGVGTEGALQITESLFKGSQDSVILDLSFCGLTPTYIHKHNSDVTFICGILELNLEGNLISEEGGNALVSFLMDPQCSLKVLILNKCQLGHIGILQLVQALAENECLQELRLADNVVLKEKHILGYAHAAKERVKGMSSLLQPEFNVSENSLIKFPSKECGSECCELEVADSEDGPINMETVPSELDDSCTSSCQKNSSMEGQFIQNLSTAISMAKKLQLLDLSNNGFSSQVVESLYASWSLRQVAGLAWKHVKDEIVHFSVVTNKCCRMKVCCRRY
ncbi:hypothetical protein K2173_018132 [Erythroxylum novogranatense]|uniref:Protein TONSOKU n=1 Tax=Erythroxylum novogranatense TaxID=1862640 RepID=A0AAV8UAP0_9ROSI|nr:hypothetical protein K2173_018132 [Erythroxylum novogranatense]